MISARRVGGRARGACAHAITGSPCRAQSTGPANSAARGRERGVAVEPGRAVGQQQAPHPRAGGDAPGLPRRSGGARPRAPARRRTTPRTPARRTPPPARGAPAPGAQSAPKQRDAPPRSRRTAFVGGRCGTSRWRSARPPPRSTSPPPGANVLEREGGRPTRSEPEKAASRSRRPGGPITRSAPSRARAPHHVDAQRHQVDAVVGVQVGDRPRRRGPRGAICAPRRFSAPRAQVQHDRRRPRRGPGSSSAPRRAPVGALPTPTGTSVQAGVARRSCLSPAHRRPCYTATVAAPAPVDARTRARPRRSPWVSPRAAAAVAAAAARTAPRA